MKNIIIPLLVCVLLFAGAGYAQPDNDQDNQEPSMEPTDSLIDPGHLDRPGTSEVEPAGGDTVIFKKGTELRGVKVVRYSPMFVEIEYLPGEPYLQIPSTQVKDVVYGEKEDPSNGGAGNGHQLDADFLPGEEVSPDFHNALNKVIATEPLVYEDQDYLDVIQQLADKSEINVDIEGELKALPQEDRKFTHTVAPDTTLLDFLRKDLLEIAPEVRVVLHYDRLALQKRANSAGAAPAEAIPEAETEPAL